MNNRKKVEDWIPPEIGNLMEIPTGDMPGDKVQIDSDHIQKANKLFPLLLGRLEKGKTVISVYGGSGVGKSEIGSLIFWYFNQAGIGACLMSGDNYPFRIPESNDRERVDFSLEMRSGFRFSSV